MLEPAHSPLEKLYSPYQHSGKNFQADQSPRYKLRVFLETDVLIFAVLNEGFRILALKEYRPKTGMEPAEILDAAIEQEPILRWTFSETQVITSVREFSLVPRELLYSGQAQDLGRALIRTDFDLAYLEQCPIHGPDAVALFTLPFPIKRKSEHYFKRPGFEAFARPQIALSLDLAQTYPDLITVHVCGKYILVTAIRGRKLIMSNSYEFSGVTDIVYFVQLAKEMLKMEEDQPAVALVGEPEPDSNILLQLTKFIPGIFLPEKELRGSFEMASEKLPSWKYAFLSY